MIQSVKMAMKPIEPQVPGAAAVTGQRLESEGGATPDQSGSTAKRSPVVPPPSPEQLVIENAQTKAGTSVLDARQEEIMAANSSDGRPPSRWVRMLEWRWFTVSAVGAIALMVTWMIIDGFSSQAVLQGLPYGVLLLLLGASPVFVSGLMRAKEQRESRALARASLESGSTP